MTAAGKINASKLEVGMRILVQVNVAIDFEGTIGTRESSRKTGENVRTARVIEKTFRAAQGRYEQRGKYVITTTEGTFEAATIQTMFLAPEDAAGIKRAHVEALAMDEEFEAARQAKADAEATERRAAYESRDEKLPEVGDVVEFIGENAGSVTGTVTETVGRMVSVEWIRHSSGQRGFDRPTDGEFAGTWKITQAEAWRERAIRCPNRWHRTGPARMRMLCPECPSS
jgi:hypothetical protein